MSRLSLLLSYSTLRLWIVLMLLQGIAFSQKRGYGEQFAFRSKDSSFVNAHFPNPKRKKLVNRLTIGGYGLAAAYLGVVWYAQEDLSHFHFFDDSREWQQMDKVGHVYGAYHASRWMMDLYKWSGEPKEKALLKGATVGFLAMSSIEVLDGFGEKWGASWSDVGANALGSGLAVLNQAVWNENRLQLKVSYRTSSYARDPANHYVLGSNFAEWFLKDYNGQTLWLSIRLHSFLPEGSFKAAYPRWLNLAIGYGAEGMIGGYGQEEWSIIRQREFRQAYLSLDIDLSNIPVRNGFLRSLFSVVNMIRIPLPAVQFDRNGVAFRAFQ
ncbi:MAG: DUF2279 domain-containing protein [Bacteroidota bacterium]